MSNDTKANEHSAGYMELTGAQKDGDCEIVEVDGGISRDRACCNLFWPSSEQTTKFSCGTCEFVEVKPLTQKEANKMSLTDILKSVRPGEKENNE
jgi:hypothetical protein